MPHALALFRADAVRAIERAAFAEGIAPFALMQRAGESAAALLRERWPEARRVGVLCGTGNNGGDGYVAALALHRAGLAVEVVALGEPRSEDARAACKAWRKAGQGARATTAPLPKVDVWIDALFGIGLTRAPEPPVADLLRRVREHAAPVMALDVPSGIDADTGAAPGAFLPASITLCFIAAKRGLFTATGREAAGEVRVDAVGLGAAQSDAPGGPVAAVSAWAVSPGALAEVLPLRRIDSHKGHHGRVLCLGGDDGMAGALVLCAEAAARSGAGWVEALTREGAVRALNARRPEVMARAIDAVHEVAARIAAADVIALGPGLGLAAWGRDLWQSAIDSGRPLVLDADGLNLLARDPRPLEGAVLTPHPGEAARLLGCTTAQIQADRFAAAEALAQRFRSVVVLKGAGTVVAAEGQVTRVIDAGNPGMASAGMGDVLTGVIAALRAQGLPAFEAAWAGALAHAAAGDRAAAGRPRGLLGSDLVDFLRELLNP